MTRNDQWKLAAVIAATLIAGWYLYPTYRFYSMTPEQREAMPKPELDQLRNKAIRLGLDLQGGMQLTLEVDKSRLSPEEAKDATDRAMEVIYNRIDQFGVVEPLIQREGEDRINIQLPGLTDRQRAIDLIGKTALLEFKLVRSAEEVRALFDRLDASLAGMPGVAAGTDTALSRHPLTSNFLSLDGAAFIRNEDLPAVERLLAMPGVSAMIPTDTQLAWGSPDQGMQGVSGRYLYVLKRESEMTGGSIASAEARVGLDNTNPGAWGVSMKMTPKGRADFSRVTGNNTNRQLAIVLDGNVNSAPVIRERIPTGDASITGSFDVESSKDLAIVLRAGALPAPVKIIEERSVGPSLGSDSIAQGFRAALIGTLLVVVFMTIYYQGSGVIAIAALALNVFYVLATLAGFGATLTLPGIAGVALSIGMAVDANVLIFERIREELRSGKSVRVAVQTGYDRAFRTIMDSNLTVILCCLFLFQFGTGPIKGFAVTMIVGLVANVVTAVLFTRMIFDWMLSRGKVERLSI